VETIDDEVAQDVVMDPTTRPLLTTLATLAIATNALLKQALPVLSWPD
jgi:hypothetical protein